MDEKIEDLIFASYCRKSSESEDKQVLSIDSQKRELKGIAGRDRLKVIDTLWESKSAYKIGRIEFAKMIVLFETGKANAILTYHLTRLARNSQDGGRIIYMMDEGLIKEIRTPERVYKNTTDDKFLMQIHFAMAKKSSDDTSDFVKRDIKTKLLKGEYPSSVGIGYLNIDKDGKISGRQYSLEKQIKLAEINRPLKRIEQDPFIAPLIFKLYEECATGQRSLDELTLLAFEWGLVGEKSKKRLSKSTLYSVLTNPLYYGAIRWTGIVHEPEELPEETRHEPIVSRELFERVQEALGLRNRPVGKKRFYTFSNLMICGTCGGNISALTSKGIVYYRCCNCTGLSYTPENELQGQLEAYADKMTIDEDFYDIALEEINKSNEKELSGRDTIIKQQQRELKQCQMRLDNLLRLKISPNNKNDELLNDSEFIEQKKEILVEMKTIREKMGDTDQQSQNWFNSCIEYFTFNKRLTEKLKTASPKELREVFEFFYYNPVISE
jgi:DNA invertase Pin-like site-specific DNA recombinase